VANLSPQQLLRANEGAGSPVEEWRASVTPQSPEQFAETRRKYEQRQRERQYGPSGNAQAAQYLRDMGGGDGFVGWLRGMAVGVSNLGGAPGMIGQAAADALGVYQINQVPKDGSVESRRALENIANAGNPDVGSGFVANNFAEPVMGTMMGIEASYGVFNTAGSTLGLLLNAPAIASGATKPGDNLKVGIPGVTMGGLGTAGGQELNPYLEDGFQWNDITSTWDMVWNNDITIGQTGMLTIGRTLNQPFWNEEGDEAIVEDSRRNLARESNSRSMYSANIGLSSEFDISDMRQLESATDQGWGRWISGGLDAAVAWWLAPEVLAFKVAGKGAQKLTTVWMTSLKDRTKARAQFELGKSFAETAGEAGRRTAIYDLSMEIAATPKTYMAQHEIALDSSNPALVADILGSTKTADEAFDSLMALGGDQDAIGRIAARMDEQTLDIGGKNFTALDALTYAQSRRAELLSEIEEVQRRKSITSPNTPGGLTPYFDNWLQRLNAQNDQLQKVVDEAQDILEPFDPIRTAVDFTTGVASGRGAVRISKLNVGKYGSMGTSRVQSQSRKARARYERITGENLWTSKAYQAGGTWGRTIRVFRGGASYMRTKRIRGWAEVRNARESLIEMESALTTNPLLRKLSRRPTSVADDALIDPVAGDWMPSAKRAINEKRDSMSPERWDEFVASGEFDAWVKQQRLETAVQFRDRFYNRVLSAPDEVSRWAAFDDFEKQMFMEMAEFYGLNFSQAENVLMGVNRMRNRIADQIRDRGWYWDQPSNEIHVVKDLQEKLKGTKFQSDLAEGKPLLDFRFIDQAFRINKGGLSGAASNVGMSATSILNTIDVIWRPLVLMRLGYTLRNVAESNLREMAYASQFPGYKNARGVASANDMKWVNLASNAADRLSNVKNFVVHGPMRYGTKGTMRALRESLDAESSALADRIRLSSQVKEKIAEEKAKSEAMIAQARRLSAIKVAREEAKRRQPGESVVWQRIEGKIERRRDFYDNVDEVLIDPALVQGLEEAGWVRGLPADDMFASIQRQTVDETIRDDFRVGGWLTQEDLNKFDSSPAGQARLQLTALSRWLDQTRGQAGIPVRVIDAQNGKYEVLHDPMAWFDENYLKGGNPETILNEINIIPENAIDSIRGARMQVGGGTLDLRPGGFGDNWNQVHMDPSVYWDELWQRLYQYSDVYTFSPVRDYPKMTRITDPLGGYGKYNDAIGYVKAGHLAEIFEDTLYNTVDTVDPVDFSRAAASEWTSPIIIDAFGDPSGYDGRMVLADGARRVLGAAQYNADEMVPVVIRLRSSKADDVFDKKFNDRGRPSFDLLRMHKDATRSYLKNGHINFQREVKESGSRFFNPRYFDPFWNENTSGVQPYMFDPMSQIETGLDEWQYFDGAPAWLDMETYLTDRPGVRMEANPPARLIVDIARTMKAAELDPVVRKQVELRLSDISDPQYVDWLREKGHLMDDTEFRDMVNALVPLDAEDSFDMLAQSIYRMNQYQVSGYDNVNGALWDGRPIDANDFAAPLITGMDYVTLNTHVVAGTKPMRVYRESGFPALEDSPTPAYLSTSTNPAFIGVDGTDYKYFLDVDPGVPYASFDRLIGNNYEQEIVLPRGVRLTKTGDEWNEAKGQSVPVYRVTLSEEDTALPVPTAAAWKAPTGQQPRVFPTMNERVQGQLGGYTYGRNSGVWTDTTGLQDFYVKDYDDPAQGFLEMFIDLDYSIAPVRRSSTMVKFADETPDRRFAYGSYMEDMSSYESVGQALARGLTEKEAQYLDRVLHTMIAEDALIMNFDALGPAGENMFLRTLDDGRVVLAKFDNGASGIYRAHGEIADWKVPGVAFDSILERARDNGYERLLRAVAQQRGYDYDDYVNLMRDRIANDLVTRIVREVEQGGPLGDRLYRYWDAWRMDAGADMGMMDSIQNLQNLFNDRMRQLMFQATEHQKRFGTHIQQSSATRNMDFVDRQMSAKLGRDEILSTPIGLRSGVLPMESRPAATLVNAIDDPSTITGSGITKELALEFARENGYGKVITPDFTAPRGYSMQLATDKVYNGGNNIDANYPGWMSEAAEEVNQEALQPGVFTIDETVERLGASQTDEAVREFASVIDDDLDVLLDENIKASMDGWVLDSEFPGDYLVFAATDDTYKQTLQTQLRNAGFDEQVVIARRGTPDSGAPYVNGSLDPRWQGRGYGQDDTMRYYVVRRGDIVAMGHSNEAEVFFRPGAATEITEESIPQLMPSKAPANEVGPVLDLVNADALEIARRTGLDVNTAPRVMEGMDIPEAAKARLAVQMANDGFDYVLLPNGKKLSQSELIGTRDAGAAYGAALAQDEVDRAAQVMLAKSDRYIETNTKIQDLESQARSLDSQVAERQANVDKALERLNNRMTKRKKTGGAIWSGGQLNEKLKYTTKTPNGDFEQSEVEIPSAFGEQASLWKQLISSNDRVAADMFGLADMTGRGMKMTQREMVLQPYTDEYWNGLANFGERHFSNDLIGEGILKGKTDDEIIQELFETDRGRSALRKLPDFEEFKDLVSRETLTEGMRDDVVAILADRRSILDTYFPDELVQQAMLDPNKVVTADLLRSRIGPRPGLQPFLGNAVEYDKGLYKRAIGGIMRVIGTLPEDKLARSPFFRNRFRESMQQQVDNYAEQGFEEFTPQMLEDMARVAREESLITLRDNLYTIQRVSTFANAMRLILPFFPAWASAAKFWLYQVPKTRPENLVRYAMVDSAPDRAGWTVDDDNQRVSGPSSPTLAMVRKLGSSNASSIFFQVPEEDLGWFEDVIGPQSTVKIPKGSVDMMLQGEFPLIPTSSPLVSVPLSWFAAIRPDITSMIQSNGDFTFKLGNDEETIVTDGTLGEVLVSRAVPFGQPTREKDLIDAAVEQYAPAWAKRIITQFRGESSSQLASAAAEIHRTRMTDWDLNDRVGDPPKYKDAVQDAMQFQTFRSLVSATAPFSPQFQSKYQFYIDGWRSIQQQGFDEGWSLDEMEAVFIERYGKEFFRYTRSKSGNQSGMAADLGEYEAATKFEPLVGELAAIGPDAKYINMVLKPFNTGEGFDPNVYAWQMDRPIPGSGGRTFRGGAAESLLETDSRIELGWKKYNAEVTRIEALAEQRGSSTDVINLAKRKIVAKMAQSEEFQPWYAEFQEVNGGRWVNSVNALYLVLNDEDFMREYGPPEDTPYTEMNRQQQYVYAIQEFVTIRNWVVEKLEEAAANGGSGNIDAKSNAALKRVVEQRVSNIGDINDDFRYMHRRFFSGDKYLRTEDLVEVSNG